MKQDFGSSVTENQVLDHGSTASESATCLLVSVRSVPELEIAIASGAAIIDLKEPRHGALAPTDQGLWIQAARRWSQLDCGTQPPRLSAALGEASEAVKCVEHLPTRFDFAKAGPSGCRTTSDLRNLWTTLRERLDDATELVAVAYADWNAAGCVAPDVVFQLASEFGLKTCLLDTFQKRAGSSLDILGERSTRDLAKTAGRLGLRWVLAGSIRRSDLQRLIAWQVVPDCIGVRGDVCLGSREGSICETRIKGWVDALLPNRDSILPFPQPGDSG